MYHRAIPEECVSVLHTEHTRLCLQEGLSLQLDRDTAKPGSVKHPSSFCCTAGPRLSTESSSSPATAEIKGIEATCNEKEFL